MKNIFVILATFMLLCGCTTDAKYASLHKSLTEYADGKDANIGIAVIIDGKDTVAVNGDTEFPMLSVYKFPIALALAEHYRLNNLPPDFPVAILPEDLHPDTYSPMTEKILASSKTVTDTLTMPTTDLLAFMLQQSDNNASDIALRSAMGAGYVKRYLNRIGFNDINVRNSEDEMHDNPALCYDNSSTSIAMATLMDKFDREFNDSLSIEIKRLMETCKTGENRLAKPLIVTNAVIGHKTGTGFTLPDGRLMAVNDAGYVHLPNGHRYSIAVFIENSGYDIDKTEEIIAEISHIVFSSIQ